MSLTMYVIGLVLGALVLGALASVAPPRNDAMIGSLVAGLIFAVALSAMLATSVERDQRLLLLLAATPVWVYVVTRWGSDGFSPWRGSDSGASDCGDGDGGGDGGGCD